MANEQFTESLTLAEMKSTIGKNDYGYVFPQGDVSDVDKIEKQLRKAGGKPVICSIDEFSRCGKRQSRPEYIITFDDDINTIIVVECKKSVAKHSSQNLDHPYGFAVDGVLYYAKYLKEEYNVIAVAVSGTQKDKMKVSTFYWLKQQETYTELTKARDIILEPKNYIELIKGKKLRKEISIDKIREIAIDMHNYLREIKVNEIHKPIFIAGILIALNDEDFSKTYSSLTSYKMIMQNIQTAIENVLMKSDIKSNRINYIQQVFKILQDNTKFSEIPLGHFKSITWYIEQLELNIKPMMDYADSTVDALGVFYNEFIKYSGGDGSGLGIVLTPQHLTEFMCELANVNKNSRVVDICCGSGAFLVTAMSKMFKKATADELSRIRQDGLYGVEFDDGLYTLAIANMIIRKDGKSNIYKGDCFNEKITKELKAKNINIGLINPPYSQKDKEELEFVEHLLEILSIGGTGVVVVPMSCAIGTKFKETRERLLKKHTLKAVFSMPNDIFYPTGTNVCVMVWEAHTPHDETTETFFGYCKDDGFVKRKKLGRIDAYNKWQSIKTEWLKLYGLKKAIDGKSALHCVTHKDEWLCEAYMNTDYSTLTQADFQQTINDYFAYLIKNNYKINQTDLLKKKPTQENLNVEKWGNFNISDLFDVKAGKYHYPDEFEDGETPYVSASNENNGVGRRISLAPDFCGNCIVNGKVGCTTFYQPNDFCATSDVNVLIPKNFVLNKYIGLFFATVINHSENYKWNYGRQCRVGDTKEIVIKLPIKENCPDWQFMENYIKSLQYSNCI